MEPRASVAHDTTAALHCLGIAYCVRRSLQDADLMVKDLLKALHGFYRNKEFEKAKVGLRAHEALVRLLRKAFH